MDGTREDTDGTQEDMDGTREDTDAIATSHDLSGVVAEAHDPDQSTSNLLLCKDDVKTAAAKFILTLKEKFKLTQVSLDYTVKAVEELLLLSNESDSGHPSPFDELKTEHQQTKFFKENFGLVVSGHISEYACIYSIPKQEPVSYELGTSFRYQQTGAKRRLVEVQETCQYVPLLQNLEKLLNVCVLGYSITCKR